MVFVKWEDYGICRFWALAETRCQFPDTCKWKHPPREEVQKIWDAHISGKRREHHEPPRLELSSAPASPRPREYYRPAYDHAPSPPADARDHYRDPYARHALPPRPQGPPDLPLPSREGTIYARPPERDEVKDWTRDGDRWYPRHDHYHERPERRSYHDPEPWAGRSFHETYGPLRGSSRSTADRYDREYTPTEREYHVRSYSNRSAPRQFTPPPVRDLISNRDVYEPPPGMDRRTGQSPGQEFDPARSSNNFVNGSMIYRFVWGEPLCVRCGNVGHLPRQCQNPPLSEAEQSFLYEIMRKEQNRSKAEKGLLTREPTTSLAPVPIPPYLGPRPTTRDGSWRPDSSSSADRPPSSYWERYRAQREPEPQFSSEDEMMAISAQQATAFLSSLAGGSPNARPQWAPPKPSKEREDMIRRAEEEEAAAEAAAAMKSDTDELMQDVKVEVEQDKNVGLARSSDVTSTGGDISLGGRGLPSSQLRPTAQAFVPLGSLEQATMGATKRMSNGEAKVIGPHPSTIRVSASYMTQAAIDKRLQPDGLDAQERSIAEAREDSVRLQGVAWLDNVRRALQLPIKTFTTACVYYHKFRLAHPKEEYSWTDAAAASLLTSCKNEDTLKKSRDILAAAHNMKQLSAHEQLGSDDPMFEAQSRMVIGIERLILESGGFDFRSRAPHHTLVKISKSLPQKPELREVSQLAWTILTDLHRTWAPLKQTSSALALASLEVAAHFKASASVNNTCSVRDDLQDLDLTQWHTTREEIMETLLDALDLYTHTSSQTILGSRYSLDDLLRIRLALNKECADFNLPRHTAVQPPPSPDNANEPNGTSRVANGHPTPVSPPQAGAQPPQRANSVSIHHPIPEGGVTLRFMLNPQRATDERAEVNRYYTEEWEEYEEEIEVPLPRDRSRDSHRDREHDRDRDRPSARDRNGRPREFNDRRSNRETRDSPRGPAAERNGDRDRTRDAEPERARARSRDGERRHEDRRPYDDRDRGRYDRTGRKDRDRRYYDDDRRRDRR